MTDNKLKNQPTLKQRRLSTVTPRNDILLQIYDANNLLSQLDNNSISLSQYFAIYMNTSDKLDSIKQNLVTSIRDYSLKKVYALLYTGYKTIPKVYLMAILGSLISLRESKDGVESDKGNEVNAVIFKRILQDLNSLIEIIPYPTNAFCARYFVLTTIKNQLNLIDTTLALNFLLENFKGMNKSINQSINEYPEQKEEDKTLTIFINENINAMLSLPGMNRLMFKGKILSEILPIIYIQAEGIYNEYIIDWIISGLSEEFTVIGLEPILAIMLPLYCNIDNNIPKKLKHIVDRLLNFLKENSLAKNELTDLNENFDQLFVYLNNIAEIGIDKCADIKLFMEFLDTMINFVLCCSKEDHKAANASSLLKIFNSYLEEYSKQNKILNQEHILIYSKYCKDLLSSKICFFDVQVLFLIAKQFKDLDMRTACYNILLLIIHYSNKIDTSDKVSIVLEMITIILKTPGTDYNSKSELESINVIIKRIFNPDPEKLFEWYLMIKNIYMLIEAGQMNLSLPQFFLCFNNLIKKCEKSYLIQNNLMENDPEESQMDLSSYTTEEDLTNFFVILYNIPKDEMRNTFSSFPEINLQYLLSTLKQINLHKIGREKMAEQFLDCLNTFIKILLGESLASNIKVDLTYQLIKIVAETSILSKEKYLMVAMAIIKIGKCLQKRTDTTRILLYSCELYYTSSIKDVNKIKELLVNACNEAEYVLVKIENLIIFPMILRKILHFADLIGANEANFLPISVVDKIIQSIVDNLPTAKEDNAKLGGDVEALFLECKAHIKEMKEKGVEYYQSINCD